MLKEEPHMKQWIRLFTFALVAACAVSLASGATLSMQERAKIHPDFRALIARMYPDVSTEGGSVARLEKVSAAGAEETYHAIVYTSDPGEVRSTGARVNSVYPGFVTVQVTAGQILALARLDGVRYIDEGSLNYPANDVSVPETGASLVQGGFLNNTQHRGAGAIVLVYDTGIDWKHKDFRSPADSTKSRILSIWDQTLTAAGGEFPPSGFAYGVEYTQAQINAELGASPPGVVREKDINGHGTHVAGTAAGNGLAQFGKFSGMAPDADIIVVKGGDGSFQEARMIDGLTYAQNKATALGKPIVVNWSIGGQVGPHDGTRAYETSVNSFVANPGRVVAIAAGNDGGSLIHAGGTAGATTTFTFTVPTYTPSAGTGTNQFVFDLWLNSNTNVSVSAMAPDGYTASANYSVSGTSGDGNNTADGLFTVYNLPSFSGNGAWNVQLWVRDNGVNFPKAGTWTLTVTNPGAAVRYDGWLAVRTLGAGLVSLAGADASETLSMPGTASGAITAAAYVTKWSWPVYANLQFVYNGTDRTGNIASFSAIGPTRDGRQKPDIAAPGQGIASALSTFSDTTGLASIIYPGQKHFVDQGTSMATPHITGASALILGAFPTATAASIKSLFTGGAIVDAFTGTVPNVTWGYGKLDALQAMAKKLSSSAVVTRTQFGYDGTAANTLDTLTGTTRYAVRISPNVSGQLTGITLNVTTPNNNPIRGIGNIICEAYTNVSGLPGAKLGSSVTFPLTRLNAGTPNYIQMLGAGVNVTSGVDFHIVVSIANPAEALMFRAENVGTGTRSSIFKGSSWAAVATNHRIRAIVTTASGVNAIEPGAVGVPIAFDLGQNYPNPFNPSTRMSYSIGERGLVTLEIFDLLGRNVATLVNEVQAPGSYQIIWNGRNGGNLPVTSGVYFCRLRSGGFSKTNRMVLLK
jgi:subtilisin family serine protease